MNIYKKLMDVQNELKAPKGQYNSFGKYKYRSCEDILEAVKPITKDHGAVIVVSDELVMIGERYYIKAVASIYSVEDGEMVSNTAYAREEAEKKGMDGSQITGTASSYARKYALNGLLCIDDTKDVDTDENKNQRENKSKKDKETKPQEEKEQEETENMQIDKNYADALIALADRKRVPIKQICDRYKVATVGILNMKQFCEAKAMLEKMPDKKHEDLGLA